MTTKLSSAFKLVSLLLAISSICQPSEADAVKYANTAVESNCTTEVAEACSKICSEGICIESPLASSSCLCKTKPGGYEYNCEEGGELVLAAHPGRMSSCEKLRRSFPQVDYYVCSLKARRDGDLLCATNDHSHEVQKRDTKDDLEQAVKALTDCLNTVVMNLMTFIKSASETLNTSIKPLLTALVPLFAELSGIVSGL